MLICPLSYLKPKTVVRPCRFFFLGPRQTIVRGAEGSDATIATDVSRPAALVFEGSGLDEALRSGNLTIEGDETLVARFLSLFPLPEPIAPAVAA